MLVIEPSLLNVAGVWIGARAIRALAWLHIQDFEIDLAFGLGQLRRGRTLANRIESWILRSFDLVTSISPRMVRRAATKGAAEDRLLLFPNWADTAAESLQVQNSLRRDLNIGPQQIVALYSGTLGAKQGVEFIVEAAKTIENAAVKFVVCGDGPASSTLRESARDLPNVMFLPLRSSSEFSQLLRMADIRSLIRSSSLRHSMQVLEHSTPKT